MPYDNILAPTLLLDPAVCRANIRRMAEKARAHALQFRPHFKTHQSLQVGRWFREAGVDRITVSSLRMAEYFADDGWEDITLAFPVNLRELDGINHLARRIRLQLTVESAYVLRRLREGLQHPAGVFLKIDAGYGRTGLAHDDSAGIRSVLEEIDHTPQLTLRGILAHGGDSYHAASAEDIRRGFARTRDRLAACAAPIRQTHPGIIISVGDTPGCTLAGDFTDIDEIRPGNFVFHDIMQLQLGVCETRDIAAALAVPVVALHPERNEIVVYGGGVHLSKESCTDDAGAAHFGLVVLLTRDGWSPPLPDTRVHRLSQEHGIIRSTPEILALLHEGALIGILPVHSCLTAECMRGYLLLDGSRADHLAAQPPFPVTA